MTKSWRTLIAGIFLLSTLMFLLVLAASAVSHQRIGFYYREIIAFAERMLLAPSLALALACGFLVKKIAAYEGLKEADLLGVLMGVWAGLMLMAGYMSSLAPLWSRGGAALWAVRLGSVYVSMVMVGSGVLLGILVGMMVIKRRY